jgi:uncharacterized protein YbjQ (UPF0145 family)
VIVATTPEITGTRILKTLGLVRGCSVRCTDLGTDIIATMKNLVGGEIDEYTKMLAEAREQALDRMMEAAVELGANAVVGFQYTTSHITSGAAEILAYGTAVILEEPDAMEIV